MAETIEVIQIRIKALERNRQVILALLALVTAVYTLVGLVLANQTALFDVRVSGTWLSLLSTWLLAVSVLLTLVLTILCLILIVYLLTNSIHNYSKILEFRQNDLYAGKNGQSKIAHDRAIAAEDQSHFFIRIGIIFLISNLFLSFTVLVNRLLQITQTEIIVVEIALSGIFAFYLVVSCYRLSFGKILQEPFKQSVTRLLDLSQRRNRGRVNPKARAKTRRPRNRRRTNGKALD